MAKYLVGQRLGVQGLRQRLSILLIALSLILSFGLLAPPAQAYENPDLLPDHRTNVIDLASVLTSVQEEKLSGQLDDFEAETGWKLRVLTQFDRTPGRAVKDFWGLDKKSFMLVADQRGGNLLNFSVGDDFYPLMPRTFWIELQTRFGNQFYIRENGEDRAIIDTIETLELCLRRGGCSVVPGLPREQWALTLVSSVVGGLVFGFAGLSRKSQGFSWQWALIFSPLWGILFLAFGVGPVVTRTSEWLPLARNVGGFLLGGLLAIVATKLAPTNTDPDEANP
jgi:TPM domain